MCIWSADEETRLARVHTDMHGNVSFLLDASGNGFERYTYDAFGQPTIHDWYGGVRSASAYGNRFLFQGREWIPELGIYDFRNRMYQPQLGRFLQKDPLGFGGGDANLFRYCGGDPVNQRDPYGLTTHTSKPDPQKRKDGNDGPGETAGERAWGDRNYSLGGGSGSAPYSTFGWWSNPDGTPTGVSGNGPASGNRLGNTGGGGGGGGEDDPDVGSYVTVIGNSNQSNGLLRFNTLSVGFTGAVPWGFIGDYFGFLLGDVQLSRAGAEARGWLAYYHPELHPTERHITQASPLYSFPGVLWGARDLGQHDTYTGAITIDPYLNVTTPEYINTMSHELMHDLYGFWHNHNDIYFQARTIEDEYETNH
jgi:RHS repeat-associated protein